MKLYLSTRQVLTYTYKYKYLNVLMSTSTKTQIKLCTTQIEYVGIYYCTVSFCKLYTLPGYQKKFCKSLQPPHVFLGFPIEYRGKLKEVLQP